MSNSGQKYCQSPNSNAVGKVCRDHWTGDLYRTPACMARTPNSVWHIPRRICMTDSPVPTEIHSDKGSSLMQPTVPRSSRRHIQNTGCSRLVCKYREDRMSTWWTTHDNIHSRKCNSTPMMLPCWDLNKNAQDTWSRASIRSCPCTY